MADGNFTNAVPRDYHDRPLIYPKPARGKTHADVVAQLAAKKKKPTAYRRTTKFIGVLEDSYTLEKWANRMVALGVASDHSLIGRLSELGPDDRGDVDRLVNEARANMRTSLKSALGSYLHHCTELKDLHGDDADLPSPAEWASLQNGHVDLRDSDYSPVERDADLAAYLEVKHRYGLRYSVIEGMRVFDPWEVAGTPDRVGTGTDPRFGGKFMIQDVKTGGVDRDDTQREIAMQLAMYAHSTLYTHEGGREADVPPVDRSRAVVIHLPVKQAKCELHFVDIAAGWAGCQHARDVWEWRKRKNVFTLVDEWKPPTPIDAGMLRLSFAEHAMKCATKDELRDLWVSAAADLALTPDFKAAVQKRLDELDGAA